MYKIVFQSVVQSFQLFMFNIFCKTNFYSIRYCFDGNHANGSHKALDTVVNNIYKLYWLNYGVLPIEKAVCTYTYV